ncbi:MAG: hypothetical protein JKY09_04690, partial [Crocinitomicaceae bacterium]|nr:hypothetical protein [Crocinitomicaceae bacterium]
SSLQTINDSLLLFGTCKDSIYLTSSNPSLPVQFDKSVGTDVIAECLDLTSITASNASLTSYFSTNNGGNAGWVFDATPSVTSSFTADGPDCYTDTTLFTNNSTVFSGNFSDITSYWYFNDGSGYWSLTSPTDSTFINYEVDTTEHVFVGAGDFNVMLVTEYKRNLCVDTSYVPVHINRPKIFVTTTESDTTICSGDSVIFDISSTTTGATFETFLNGVSQNTPSIDDTLFITAALNHLDTVSFLSYENGCISDTMPTYVYTVYDLPIVSWVSSDLDSTICYTDSVSFTASGTDNYQFFINQSSVTGYVPSGFYWSDTLNNSDTVYFVGKDETTNCLMAATPMIFTVNPLPTTSFTESVGGNVICAGDTVTFTGSGADTYEFFIDGLSVSGPGGATYITSSLITGDTITVLGYTVNGCTKYASESYTYTVNPLPNVSMTLSDADTSICSGNNVSFTASGAALYEFFINGASQGAQSSATTFNSTTLADNDLVYVEGDFSGCIQRSDSAQFTVLTSPTTNLVSDDADATICAEDMVNFTASGATNYEFFIDGISQGPASPTNSFSTTSLTNGQTVSVNGESNTCIVAQGINFTVLSLPSVGLFSDDVDNTICQAEPITFTGANATAYELFVNNISQGPAQASPTFTPTLPNGTNTVYIIGTAGNGCTDTSQTVLNVTVNAIPTVILTSSDADNVICAGETVVFSGTGSDLYQFFIDGISQGSLSATNTLATTDLLDGQVVSITGSTLGCAGVSNTIPNTVNPIPNVTLSSTDIDNVYCIGTSVDYTAAGAANYEFFVDGVSQGPSSPTNVLNSAGFVVGNYLVEVQGEQNNCSNNASYIVTVNGLPTVNMTSSDADNVICTGDMVTYTATGGDLYEFEIDGFSQGAPSPINTFTSTLVNGNVVSVVGTSAQGCTMLVSELPITVNTTPTVTLTSSDIDFQICIGDNVDFTGSGSTDYEFFINTISQGPASTTPTLSTSGLSNNDVIEVVGTTTGCSATSNTLNFTVFNYPVVSLINNGESEIC